MLKHLLNRMTDSSIPPKKRRKIGASTSYVAASNQLGLLPDNALLLIMWYLDSVSLKRFSAVNRRLYHLSADRSLWRVVDLSLVMKSQNNRKLHWIINHVLKSSTIKISIYAYKAKFNLTNNVLKLLHTKCPQIKNLSFISCSLKSLTWRDFVHFTTLTHLSIEKCGTNFFNDIKFNQFPKLTHFSYSGNTLFNVDVTKVTTLTSINLIGCTNIWNTTLKDIANAKELCYLSLPFSALIEEHRSDIQLLKLKSLVIGGNDIEPSRVPIQNIQKIAHVSPNLVFLDVSSCDYHFSLDNSDKLVLLVTKLPYLNVLGIVSQDVAKEELENLSSVQPNLILLKEKWKLLTYKIRNKLPTS